MKVNWILVLCVISLLLSLFSIYEINKNQSVAFVDIGIVFEGFEMKKELQKKFNNEVLPQQRVVDSLEQIVAALNIEFQNNPSDLLGQKLRSTYENLNQFKAQADEKASSLKTKLDEQVQTRLHQYLQDFAQKEGLSMLLSTIDGNTIIHGEASFDLTNEAIEFVNNKYSGNE